MSKLIAPVYFFNFGRVVRGRVDRRHAGHVLTVVGERYLLPDGTEHPVPVDFTLKLRHEEVTAEAAPLLALAKPPTNWVKAKKINAAILEHAS